MNILKFYKNPIALSVVLTLVIAISFSITAIYVFNVDIFSPLFWGPNLALVGFLILFNSVLIYRRKQVTKEHIVDTEEESLTASLSALIAKTKKKPIYLLLGTKGAGKNALLNYSGAIKPIDRKRTVQTDFFLWMESDDAIYVKPNNRLIYQEQSNTDEVLWKAFIQQFITSNPRKPLAGCLLCCDLEYLITHEDEQVEYTLNLLNSRLIHIVESISCSLPLYLFMTKIDKLHGFKEYMSVSPIKSQIEHLTIPLRDAKGAINDFFNDSFENIVTSLEKHVLECTSKLMDTDEKQAVISFPKQFELCKPEVLKTLNFINNINNGMYFIDLRSIFFTSSLQGGRKYNLLAKSCSNYFNLPIIASEYTQLSETPYFTRFVIDAHVLPESEFAGENKRHLQKLIRNSRIVFVSCTVATVSIGYLLFQTLNNNLFVINDLIETNGIEQNIDNINFNNEFNTTVATIAPYYQAWINANDKLDNELLTMKVSKVEEVTKMAHQLLMTKIEQILIPLIEKSLSKKLVDNPANYVSTLDTLKAYLMLSEVDKRDTTYLINQIELTLRKSARDQDNVDKTLKFLNAYMQQDFMPVAINMDLVRSTRRHLLSKSKIDMVYGQILTQAQENDLGELNLQRAVGFEFNDVFSDRVDNKILTINKVFTSTGYSTFYRPRSELLSKQVITDNWALGLSNNLVPSDKELQSFTADVRKKYTDDYISYWRNALSEIKLREFNNIVDLTNTIDLMSGPSSPLTTVLKELFTNTKFSPNEDQLALLAEKNTLLEAAIETAKEKTEEIVQPDYILMSRVEKAFEIVNQLSISETKNSPTPWDQIIESLSKVRTYMKDITDAPNIQIAALNAAKTRMRGTQADPLIRLKQIAQKSPEPIRSWLLDVVNQTWRLLLVEAQKGIQDNWYSEIYSEFRNVGLNRYPFNKKSPEDISLIEFEKFFAQGGTLDAFIKNNLAPFYDTNLWQAKRVDGEYLPLSQELIVQLKNFNTIKSTLIDHTTNTFNVPFSIKVVDLDSSAIRANIDIADQSISYYHGPSKIKELTWPPSNGNFDVNLTIQDISKEGKQHTLAKEGQWALYRLFDESNLTTAPDGGFITEIKVSGRDLTIKVKPSAPKNPFTLVELFNFTVPEKINI